MSASSEPAELGEPTERVRTFFRAVEAACNEAKKRGSFAEEEKCWLGGAMLILAAKIHGYDHGAAGRIEFLAATLRGQLLLDGKELSRGALSSIDAHIEETQRLTLVEIFREKCRAADPARAYRATPANFFRSPLEWSTPSGN